MANGFPELFPEFKTIDPNAGTTVTDPEVLRRARETRVGAAPRRRLARIFNPNITRAGLGRFARGGAAAAPVIGAAQAFTDTPETAAALGQSVGLEGGPARVGGNILNFLARTGNVASLGLADFLGGGLANLIAGRPFSEARAPTIEEIPSRATTAAPTAAPATPAPTAAPAAPGARRARQPAQIGAVSPIVTPVTSPAEIAAANAFIESAAVPAPGTGFIRNEQTGAIQRFTGGATPPAAPAAPAVRSTGVPAIDDIINLITTQGIPEAQARSRVAAGATATKAQADLVKALADLNKPEETTVIPSLDPSQPPTVVQVRGGAAAQLPVSQTLPPGETRESMLTKAQAAVRAGRSLQDVNKTLAAYGLSPLALQ